MLPCSYSSIHWGCILIPLVTNNGVWAYTYECLRVKQQVVETIARNLGICQNNDDDKFQLMLVVNRNNT